jgi:hypothetical protein
VREQVPASVALIARATAKGLGLPLVTWLSIVISAQPAANLLDLTEQRARRQVKELADALQVNPDVALRLIVGEPRLLCLRAGSIKKRMTALRRIIGLPTGVWRQCVRKRVRLLTSPAVRFAKQIEEQRRVLHLTRAAYRRVFVREPRITVCSAAAIRGTLDGMSDLWSMTRAQARSLIARSPKLATSGLIATMNDRIDEFYEILSSRRFRSDSAHPESWGLCPLHQSSRRS